MWIVALNQVRHRSYWGSVGNGGVMTPGVEWWDRWWERISMSPGQGEMNDGETPSPNGVRDVVNSMPWSLEDPFAGDTGAAAGAPCPKQAPRNGQTVEVLGGERPTRLPEPAGAGLGARRGGRKFDAPPAAPPPTTMTDAVAPMDDGMEHGDQDHKHLAYTIPGSQESLQYAYAQVNGIVAVEGRPWHGVGDAIGSSGPRPHAENGTENNRQPRKSSHPRPRSSLPGSKDDTTLLHRGRAARSSNQVSIHALFFVNDIGRHRFASKPKKLGGSIVCRQLVNFSPSRKISVSVLRFLSHPDLNIDFPGVCPGPAPLPPDFTSIPPSHTNLKKLEGPRSSGSFSSQLNPSFSPIPL